MGDQDDIAKDPSPRRRRSCRTIRSAIGRSTVAEWVAFCGTEAAIVAWAVRSPMVDTPTTNGEAQFDLVAPDSKLTTFLRYYRQVLGGGTIDPALIDVAEWGSRPESPQ